MIAFVIGVGFADVLPLAGFVLEDETFLFIDGGDADFGAVVVDPVSVCGHGFDSQPVFGVEYGVCCRER